MEKSSNGNGHRRGAERLEGTGAVRVSAAVMPQTNMVEYPFPLQDGQIARLVLSRNIKTTDVKRLSAFLSTLVVDVEPGV